MRSPDPHDDLACLLADVVHAVETLPVDELAARTLEATTVRPLREELARRGDGLADAAIEAGRRAAADGAAAPDLVELATRAAELAELGTPRPVAVVEALAGLVHAGVSPASGLTAPPGGLLTVVPGGPYLAVGVDRLTDWLGVELELPPVAALCRCGRSSAKPFCDGSHARGGFSTTKDPDRVPDRLDTYPGLQVTIEDNRGTCAHSGFCTDRLASVFRLGEEPFVAPSGARLDEILRAVRACPSGALRVAPRPGGAGDDTDQDRPPAIEVTRDGPYRVTGGIPLVDEAGATVPQNAGASREHYSLCRCGASQNKPFCSGMHWTAGFHDPPMPPSPSLFAWVGGRPGLRALTRRFYEVHVPADPLIGPVFAHMSPEHPEHVADWLAEVFGGPATYTEQRGGYQHMIAQHLGRHLTEEQRARWVRLLERSADDIGVPRDAEFRAAFTAYLEWGSRIALENSQPGAHPPPVMTVPRWWWVCDATPAARISALAPPADEAPLALPAADETPGFAAHVRPLFRETDRASMRFAFDLWEHEDVREHADAILARVREGTMPCDGAWPVERVDVFARWIAAGCPG